MEAMDFHHHHPGNPVGESPTLRYTLPPIQFVQSYQKNEHLRGQTLHSQTPHWYVCDPCRQLYNDGSHTQEQLHNAHYENHNLNLPEFKYPENHNFHVDKTNVSLPSLSECLPDIEPHFPEGTHFHSELHLEHSHFAEPQPFDMQYPPNSFEHQSFDSQPIYPPDQTQFMEQSGYEYNDQSMMEQEGTTQQPWPFPVAEKIRDKTEGPTFKLSVALLRTYKQINQVRSK